MESEEPGENPLWFFKDILLHGEDKTAALNVISKGICFCIKLSPSNLDQTPETLQKCLELMEDVCNDGDLDVSEEAEQDLQYWVLEPFLEIFENLESSSNQQHISLQEYLSPETYRYQMVLLLAKANYHHNSFRSDQTISRLNAQVLLSQFRSSQEKVSAAGTVYHFKSAYSGNLAAALREMDIYRKLDEILPCDEIRIPAVHGVVRDESGSLLIGLLFSSIECGPEDLECILMSEMLLSSSLRDWRMQITTTVTKLHEAGIVWGDTQAANILIDSKDNACVVDFGGGFTEGWVEKSQMDIIEGDLAALIKIEEPLQPEKT
ncbi:hypothetical protein ABOM_003865 [Aspergillus bombycis]|uniref:Protein kinase domain-containing protein n=1 Tax=Aspergillus bombycis TaxID=109264 RepID=A0A1F8A783_9EURO|nr:hypothetical protein ABOM_003865 [Aspergillus bombycis]OGM47269.1 hypothetical protein ABOM_003865 [Aspergillus bombycis]